MTQVHQGEIVTPKETALAQRQQAGIEQTIGQSLEAQVRAGIEARYMLAMRQPRDLDLVRQRVLNECRRPGFAQVARYAKPQGNGKVYGPTIRFVEAAIRCMTNVFHETTAIYEDQFRRVLRVSVTDLEANACHAVDVTVQKTVERSSGAGREVLGTRTNTQNKMVYIVACTEDELLVKQNAMLSKALRNLGLKLIPGDIVDEAQQLVVEVQEQGDKADPEGARKKVFDGFADIGITPPEIKEYLGREVGPGDLAHLRALFQALRSGDVNWREVLQEKRDGEPGEASKTLADRLAAKAAKVKAQANGQPAPAASEPIPVAIDAALHECETVEQYEEILDHITKTIPRDAPCRQALDRLACETGDRVRGARR